MNETSGPVIENRTRCHIQTPGSSPSPELADCITLGKSFCPTGPVSPSVSKKTGLEFLQRLLSTLTGKLYDSVYETRKKVHASPWFT